MTTLRLAAATLAAVLASGAGAPAQDDGWVSLFDGKTLNGWKASDAPGTFSVKDGRIVVHGPRSHLFYDGPVKNHDFTNFEWKAEVMTTPGSNSGMYFHTLFQETGWPRKGYEVQVNNSHKDPKRTAGLYDVVENYDAVATDGEWFTLTVRVEGRRIRLTLNGHQTVDYTEPDRSLPVTGLIALQIHGGGKALVRFRNITIEELR